MSVKGLNWLIALLALSACDQLEKDANAATPGVASNSASVSTDETLVGRTGTALLDQIKCQRPPQAGIAMSAMLKNHLIARTDDGGDGIIVFVPVQPLKLLGFDVVRLAGWQPDEDGGAMAPFTRGPGTSPPNHIAVTVKASLADVRRELLSRGIVEGHYVPDTSQEAWVGSDGESHTPQRLVPGPMLNEGEYDGGYIRNPLPGVSTIQCSASDGDFEKEVAAQFSR